jgi:hypothetical protein
LTKKSVLQNKKPLKTKDNFVNFEIISTGIIVALLASANLGVSAFIRENEFLYINNQNPIGFTFGYYSSIFILFFVSWATIKFNLLKKYPIYTILILTGVYSNFSESLIWAGVADYLTIRNFHFNLADIQIVLGLFMVNLDVWFTRSSK